MANFRNIRKFEMGITNWKNLPTMDLVSQTLVVTKNDTLFEKRLAIASERLEYTKSEMEAIRTRRNNYLKMQGRDRRVFL